MRKLLASIGAVLVLCGFAQLLFGKEPEAKAGIMEYYRLSAESSVGGGLIGGLICKGLTSVLGNVGAFLVLVVGFAVSAVCITERSLVKVIKKQGGRCIPLCQGGYEPAAGAGPNRRRNSAVSRRSRESGE